MAEADGLPRVEFGEWTPDLPRLGSGLRTCKGVLSRGGRYAPKPSLSRMSGTAQISSGAILGAFSCYTSMGGGSQHHMFAATKQRLYRIANSTPVDLSRDGQAYTGVDQDWVWSFEQFGDNILAGARGVRLQRWRFGEDRWFRDIPDSGTDDLAPRTVDAMGRIGPHVLVAAGLNLKWCAFNNVDWWTPDVALQSGETTLASSGGGVVAIRGGESGAIFQERSISRIAYQGGSAVFQLDEVEVNRGAMSPKGVIGLGRNTFYVSEEGFFLFNGLESQNIGENKVNKWFQDRVNYAYRARISASFDVKTRSVIVSYPANGSSTPNEQLIWSTADNRWSYDDEAIQIAWEAGREGVTVDGPLLGGLNIDTLTTSVDSPEYRESRRQWAAVDTSGYLCLYEGGNRAATLETGEFEVLPGRRGMVTEVWPLIDAPKRAIGIKIGTKGMGLAETAGSVGTDRTNLLTYSHALSPGWTATRCDLNGTYSGSEKTLSATSVRDDVSATTTHLLARSFTFTAGESYVFEAIAYATNRTMRLLLPAAAFGSNVIATFDVINGAVLSSSGPLTDVGMLPAGNGFWHCYVIAPATIGAAGSMQIAMADATGAVSYTGDGASRLYLDGVQLVVGTQPTPIIRTTDAAITLSGAPVRRMGFAPLRASGRFLSATVSIVSGETWTEAVGIEHNARPTGGR